MNRANSALEGLPLEELAAFCRRHHIRELAVFGSILGPGFTANSDVDFLATLEPHVRIPMSRLLAIEEELAAIVGRRVDLVLRPSLLRSKNILRKQAILESAQVLYAA